MLLNKELAKGKLLANGSLLKVKEQE